MSLFSIFDFLILAISIATLQHKTVLILLMKFWSMECVQGMDKDRRVVSDQDKLGHQ